jgi:hypothetical protein
VVQGKGTCNALGGRSRLAERRNAVYIGILRWEVGRWDRRRDDAVETQVSMGAYRPYCKTLYWTC